jgi:hypothetical protein
MQFARRRRDAIEAEALANTRKNLVNPLTRKNL